MFDPGESDALFSLPYEALYGVRHREVEPSVEASKIDNALCNEFTPDPFLRNDFFLEQDAQEG